MQPKRQLVVFILFLLVFLGILAGFSKSSHSRQIHLEPPSAAIPENLFGMHIHFAAIKHPEYPTTTPWPAVPFATWRLWDAASIVWPRLEPRKEEWHWEILDKTLDLAQKHQVEVLMTLGQSPRWASARPTERSPYAPGAPAEPKNIEDWRNYVRTVAMRYKGQIRYYEIWNEPNWKRFYTGTHEEMLKLAREAYGILKAVDPSIQVISPSPTGGDEGISWLTEYLAKGGGNYADIIGFHFYISQPPEALVPLIRKVQAVTAKYGVRRKPLWNTEMGWSAPKPFPSDELAAAYVARAYILNWAAGVSRFYWYAWDNQGWVSLRMTEPDIQTLKSAAIAYREVQKWLVGARMSSCNESENIWNCHLTREGGYNAWIVWNPNSKLPFEIPESWRVRQVRDLTGDRRNLLTNNNTTNRSTIEISPSPLLLENRVQS